MTEVKRPTKPRESLYPQQPKGQPLTPDQARQELGWKLLPGNTQHSHDD